MESHKKDQVPAPSKSHISGQEGYRALQKGIDTYHKNLKQAVRKRRHNIGVPPDVHELLTKIAKRHKRTLIGQIAYWCDRETII